MKLNAEVHKDGYRQTASFLQSVQWQLHTICIYIRIVHISWPISVKFGMDSFHVLQLSICEFRKPYICYITFIQLHGHVWCEIVWPVTVKNATVKSVYCVTVRHLRSFLTFWVWPKMTSNALMAPSLKIAHNCLPVVVGTTPCAVSGVVVRMFVINCDRTISNIGVMDVAIHLQYKTPFRFQ
jgi:hypothetical protein